MASMTTPATAQAIPNAAVGPNAIETHNLTASLSIAFLSTAGLF
jgi:hypothetical protein